MLLGLPTGQPWSPSAEQCSVLRLPTASRIECLRGGARETIAVESGDLAFFQNGSMTDASSLGAMTERAAPTDQGRQRWLDAVGKAGRGPTCVRQPVSVQLKHRAVMQGVIHRHAADTGFLRPDESVQRQ